MQKNDNGVFAKVCFLLINSPKKTPKVGFEVNPWKKGKKVLQRRQEFDKIYWYGTLLLSISLAYKNRASSMSRTHHLPCLLYIQHDNRWEQRGSRGVAGVWTSSVGLCKRAAGGLQAARCCGTPSHAGCQDASFQNGLLVLVLVTAWWQLVRVIPQRCGSRSSSSGSNSSSSGSNSSSSNSDEKNSRSQNRKCKKKYKLLLLLVLVVLMLFVFVAQADAAASCR